MFSGLPGAPDKFSIRCMICHDALLGSDSMVTNPALDPGVLYNGSLGASHPIGANYADIKASYKGAFKGPLELPEGMKLLEGKVGCASCHNPYSKSPRELVVSNDGSDLCFSCHNK